MAAVLYHAGAGRPAVDCSRLQDRTAIQEAPVVRRVLAAPGLELRNRVWGARSALAAAAILHCVPGRLLPQRVDSYEALRWFNGLVAVVEFGVKMNSPGFLTFT